VFTKCIESRAHALYDDREERECEKSAHATFSQDDWSITHPEKGWKITE
jgi:hypothetical protein